MEINRFKPAVPKKILFLIAALVWGGASYKVLSVGWAEIVKGGKNFWLDLVVIVVVGCIFFKYVIFKIYKKHTKRILNVESTHLCMFSFFDVKSYMVMAAMILLGISLRRLELLPPLYLGPMYISIGIPLFLASLLFVHTGINIESAKVVCCQETEADE